MKKELLGLLAVALLLYGCIETIVKEVPGQTTPPRPQPEADDEMPPAPPDNSTVPSAGGNDAPPPLPG